MHKAVEVATMLGVTINTIENWYRFKRAYPDNEYAQMIPDIKHKEGNSKTRYWTDEDVYKLAEFKKKVPSGCKGIMGAITQRYVKKGEK